MSEQQKWAVMCSMTGGWGVARPEHVFREDDGLLACIEWESLHDTWAEAMQYADTQARTVTVTLPRVQDRHEIKVSDNSTGKILKPEGWTTPDIEAIVEA